MNKSKEFQRRLSLPTLSRTKFERGVISQENENIEFNSLKKDNDVRKRLTFSTPSLKGFHPIFKNEHFTIGSFVTRNNSQNNAVWLKEKSPSMTQSVSVSRGPADPEGSAGAPLGIKNFENAETVQTSRSSKSRQKKFHRHFKQVDIEEKVLNYYSCALVGDILLQGHLYITQNFFAFYSNVFGYVTKLLIPTVNVLKISKEKTAKIIPNAVGVFTEDEKHVFGSLLSRDSTYKFMMEVWKAANSSQPMMSITPPEILKPEPSDEDSSVSSGNDDSSPSGTKLNSDPTKQISFRSLLTNLNKNASMAIFEMKENDQQSCYSVKTTVILVILVSLLVFLFASAGYLLHRIILVQNYLTIKDLTFSSKSDVYEDILNWQSTLHSKSADKIEEFLSANLKQISKIRLSLEALSVLMLSKSGNVENSNFHGEMSNVKTKKMMQEIFSDKA